MRSLLIGWGDAGSKLVETIMHIQDSSNDGKKPYFDLNRKVIIADIRCDSNYGNIEII